MPPQRTLTGVRLSVRVPPQRTLSGVRLSVRVPPQRTLTGVRLSVRVPPALFSSAGHNILLRQQPRPKYMWRKSRYLKKTYHIKNAFNLFYWHIPCSKIVLNCSAALTVICNIYDGTWCVGCVMTHRHRCFMTHPTHQVQLDGYAINWLIVSAVAWYTRQARPKLTHQPGDMCFMIRIKLKPKINKNCRYTFLVFSMMQMMLENDVCSGTNYSMVCLYMHHHWPPTHLCKFVRQTAAGG